MLLKKYLIIYKVKSVSILYCKFCSSPLPSNSLICSYCKQRNLILPLYTKSKILDEQQILCVECHTDTMEFVDLGDYVESLEAKQCYKCKGIFISFEILEKAIMHYGLKRKKIPKKIDMPKEKKINQNKLYACPICKRTMKRFVYKISSCVLIDKCESHGVWLNHGELRLLIEWKQSFKKFQDREKSEKAYLKHGLKKTKSKYTYQKNYATNFERFFEWLMGV